MTIVIMSHVCTIAAHNFVKCIAFFFIIPHTRKKVNKNCPFTHGNSIYFFT